jgi:AbrB family looped-hinge helix DNA binding protein
MSKVTSKLQVTIPKAVAVKYGIRPGDEVRWEELPRGVVLIRVAPGGEGTVGEGAVAVRLCAEERLALFRGAVDRQAKRQKGRKVPRTKDRGWKREDLYGDRGSPR